MNKYVTRLLALVVSGCALGIALNSYAYDIYNNTTRDMTNNFSLGTTRTGDEITPAGSGWLSHVDIQYYLTGPITGNETAQVWLYQNDGTATTLGNRTANAPFTTLWSSTPFNIGAYGATTRSTLNFDAADITPFSVWISGNFNLTLAIQFAGLGTGESAGVTLYDFPSVGGSYNTYWTFNGSTWSLVSDPSAPSPDGGSVGYVDFGMRIDAVPEPTTFSLVVLGGLVFGLGRRFRRK